ncbi:MAG: helicase C-terminal domain-containing protein [Candidatus Odinarchaeota archaeon]
MIKSKQHSPLEKSLLDRLAADTYSIFPYQTFKNQQGRLIQKVLLTDRLIVQAPTGSGKTSVMLSSLLPFVKLCNARLIIATRTKMQIFSVFMKEFRKLVANIKDEQLMEQYSRLKIVPLVGKTSMCTNRSAIKGQSTQSCNLISAPCKHYSKSKGMKYDEFRDAMNGLNWIDDFKSLDKYKESLMRYGCPYQFAWRMAYTADVIIVTHAYLKNPDILSLLLHVLDNSNEQNRARHSILLIDEAHDFGPVVRSQLTRRELDFLAEQFPHDIVLELRKEIMSKTGLIDALDVSSLDIEVLKLALGSFHENARKSKDKKVKDSFYKNARMTNNFIEFLQTKSDYWAIVPPRELDLLPRQGKSQNLSVEDIAELELDKRVILIEPFPEKIFASLSGFMKVILMSGTFKPLDLYTLFYGLKEGKHPYQEWITKDRSGNRFEAILVNKSFSSSYKQRDVQLYERYGNAIKQLHGINPNHTVVFCPSYEFKNGLMQHVGTKYEEKSRIGGFDWLDELQYLNHELIVATSGGKLVEGIEILQGGKGRSLITMVIFAGLPYPPPDFITREILARLYSKKWNKNTASSLLNDLPLLRNIQQGSGRGIRNPDDFSASIILDWRGQYLNVFDRYVKTHSLSKLISKIQEFYRRNYKSD